MENRLRAIVVDDERLARQKLRTMLDGHPEVMVVGEAATVEASFELIRNLKPDVLFLDIQLSGESGFDLLQQIDISAKVVFVTAFDAYAIRAFEVNALDYLLKPVKPERLARAISRLSNAAPVEGAPDRSFEYEDRLFITVNERASFIKISAIKLITAAGVYSELNTSDDRKVLLLRSLREWEQRLPENYFMRIHRSAIINLEYVEHVEQGFNYAYKVKLTGLQQPVMMSRRYAARLKDKMS